MFEIRLPESCQDEARWVLSFVFGEVFGLEFCLTVSAEPDFRVSLNGRNLDLPDIFFPRARAAGLGPGAVPVPPLEHWDPAGYGLVLNGPRSALPILFGSPGADLSETRARCNVDIIGTIFFMMSRYEELVSSDRDAHDRFPACASLAAKAGFLDRPIVDEYIELLAACLKHLWPGLDLTLRRGSVRVSCDVDVPFDPGLCSTPKLVRSLAADLLKRRSPSLAWRRARNLIASGSGDFRFDPYYTFEWYLETCERRGRKLAFYFIPENTAGDIDGSYELSDTRILSLIRRVADRGHEIGMHGSYDTFRDPSLMQRERARLIAACGEAGVPQVIRGNRQHYLRWDAAQTPDHLESAGFDYDTTGSFADAPGFRYGTSRQFTMWSWRRNAPLRIRQHPLVLMEASVLADRYLGLGNSDEALQLMLRLKSRALEHGGDFTLLWHNHTLLNGKDREYFSQLVA